LKDKMDLHTHPILAYRMLVAAELDPSASIYAIIPGIDQKPGHYHRIYCHNLNILPKLFETASRILNNQPTPEFDYLTERLLETRLHYHSIMCNVFEDIKDHRVLAVSKDPLSAMVSIISHFYFDTFNNPVQVFLPEDVSCAGQWDLWREIDFIRFRDRFYHPDTIKDVRRELSNHPLWQEQLNGVALITAQIRRLQELSYPPVHDRLVERQTRKLLAYIQEKQPPDDSLEYELLLKLENEIRRWILHHERKYLQK